MMAPALVSAIIRYLSALLLITAFSESALAEIMSYECAVGEVAIFLRVDTNLQTVRQTNRVGPVTEVGEYSDGVYGPVSQTGAAGALIPRVHQFVRITGELISYGAELGGVEDLAVFNRRLATIVLPSGKGGWCQRTQ
jgi:hypothetical protein